MVDINNYSDTLKQRFDDEKRKIKNLISNTIVIEHVGSSAIGIGGKNIIDILIGVSSKQEMEKIMDILVRNGYFEGNDSHDDRIFLASRAEETKEGDFHIHICPLHSESYNDFIILRDFLIANPKIAKEYFEKKHEFAKKANYDRKKYKSLKSEYISTLLCSVKKASFEAYIVNSIS